MARGRRAPYKKSRGSRKRRARSRERSGDDEDDDDHDYAVEREDETESSYESDVSPSDSSAEESFDFGVFSSGSEEEIEVAPSKRRTSSSAAPRKPRKRPRDLDDDEDEAISAPRRKAKVAGSRRRRSRVSDQEEEEEDDDEDFSPDEDDDEDDEEEASPVAGKRSRSRRKVVQNRRGRKRKSKVLKPKERKTRKPAASPVRKRRRRAAPRSEDDDDFIVKDLVVADNNMKKRKKVRRKKKTGSRKTNKRLSVDSESSDSDFVVSNDELVAKDRFDSDFVVSDDDFIVRDRVTADKQSNKGKTARKKRSSSTSKRRKLEVSDSSDSDFMIPEEEVRELGIGGILNQPQPKRIFAGRKGEQKGKEKEADVSEKQVCGICLSEEQKMAIQGVLNCCTHYFCFACIMEWSKVESRCPVCKRRFVTISKSSRSDTGFGLRRAVIRVQKRDQVYQPSEEEMRSLLDPFGNVVCMVCEQGGDDNLMLICDSCESSAHTYCVGLEWEVPEGDWYCECCRFPHNGSSNSQVQDTAIDQGTSSSDLFSGGIETEDLSTNMHANRNPRRSVSFSGQRSSLTIDLNVPPRHLSGEGNGVTSPASGAGSSSLSRTLAIYQDAHVLKSEDLSTNMHASINSRRSASFPAESSSQRIDLNFPPRHLSRGDDGVASQASSAGASTLSGRRAIHRHIRIMLSDSRPRQIFSRVDMPLRNVESDVITSEVGQGVEAHMSGGLSPLHTVSGSEQHQRNTTHIFQSNANLAPCMFNEGSSFRRVEGAKEQVQSMVKSHLKNLSRDSPLDRDTFKEIARRCTHTILAACGIEHRRSAVAAPVEPPDSCSHDLGDGPADLLKGCCSSCFSSFVRDVVRKLMDAT